MLIKLHYLRQSRRLRIADEVSLDLQSLHILVREAFSFHHSHFGLTYIDDENERITISDEQDFKESLKVFDHMKMVPKYYIDHQESPDIPTREEEYTDLLRTLYFFFKNSGVNIGQFLNDCRDITRQPGKTDAAQDVIQQFARQVNTLARKHSLPNPNHPTPFDGAIRRLLTRANTLQVPHEGVVCDGCQADPLFGVRYKCNHCPNFDYCQLCFDCLPHNSEHTFRAIVVPKTRNFLKEVLTMAKDRLTRIRTQSVEHIGSELEVIPSIQQPMFTMDNLSTEDNSEDNSPMEEQSSQQSHPQDTSPNISQGMDQQQQANQVHEINDSSANAPCLEESPPTVYLEASPTEVIIATWILCNTCRMPLRELVVTCTGHPEGIPIPAIQISTTPLLPLYGEQYTLSIFMTAPEQKGCHSFKFVCEYEDGSFQTLILIADVSSPSLEASVMKDPQHDPELSSATPVIDLHAPTPILERFNDDDGNDNHDAVVVTDSAYAPSEKSFASSMAGSQNTLTIDAFSQLNKKDIQAADKAEDEFGVASYCNSTLSTSDFGDSSLATGTFPATLLVHSIVQSEPANQRSEEQAEQPTCSQELQTSETGEPSNIKAKMEANVGAEAETEKEANQSPKTSSPIPLITGNVYAFQAALEGEMQSHQLEIYVQTLAEMGFTDADYVRNLLLTMQDYNLVLQKLLQESLDMWTVVETDDANDLNKDI